MNDLALPVFAGMDTVVPLIVAGEVTFLFGVNEPPAVEPEV